MISAQPKFGKHVEIGPGFTVVPISGAEKNCNLIVAGSLILQPLTMPLAGFGIFEFCGGTLASASGRPQGIVVPSLPGLG